MEQSPFLRSQHLSAGHEMFWRKIHTLGYETMSVVTNRLSYPRRLESSMTEAKFSKDETMTYAQPCNYTACSMILLPYFRLFYTWFAVKVPQINYVISTPLKSCTFPNFCRVDVIASVPPQRCHWDNRTQTACQHILYYTLCATTLYSQGIKTNLLHNTPFYLQLDVQPVSARFIGRHQGVVNSDVST
jgi:hypothetical protein